MPRWSCVIHHNGGGSYRIRFEVLGLRTHHWPGPNLGKSTRMCRVDLLTRGPDSRVIQCEHTSEVLVWNMQAKRSIRHSLEWCEVCQTIEHANLSPRDNHIMTDQLMMWNKRVPSDSQAKFGLTPGLRELNDPIWKMHRHAFNVCVLTLICHCYMCQLVRLRLVVAENPCLCCNGRRCVLAWSKSSQSDPWTQCTDMLNLWDDWLHLLFNKCA